MPVNEEIQSNSRRTVWKNSTAEKDEFGLEQSSNTNRVSILVGKYEQEIACSREPTLIQEGTRKERDNILRAFAATSPIGKIVEDNTSATDMEIQNLRINAAQPVHTSTTERNPSKEIANDVEGYKTTTKSSLELKLIKSEGPTTESGNSNKKEIPTSQSITRPSNESINLKKPENSQGLKISAISEWSHHAQDPQQEEDVQAEDEWQEMPSYASYDIYDDDNRLIAKEKEDSDEEEAYMGIGGAGRGYTRVQLDEDAQSATSLDENTQYLFKDVNGTGTGEMEDEEHRDALSQMQATKNLLTEGQRIAYVGTSRLVLSSMIKQSEDLMSRGAKKETTLAAEAMKMWSQKMMVRLYAHMEISSAEQIMIEQLSEHDVVASDLTPTLMQNARVKNPMAETSDPSKVPTSPRSPESKEEMPASAPPPYQDHEGVDLPEVRTPSQLPKTANLDIDLRWTVLCDIFLTLIADSVYDARSRVLLEQLGKHLGVDWLEICRFEKRVTDALEMQQEAEKENWDEDEHKESRRKMALKKRYIMMGLATVGGSLVIGLSAGLLAPMIGAGLAAGFSTIGVAGTGGFLAGTGGAAIITSGAAASGGIIAVRAADRRTGAVKTFEYRPLHNNRRVNLIITVSGWMTGKVDDVRLPYSTVDPIMGDIYSVLWEPEMLRSMGDTINILATEALTQGLQQVLGSTILITLMAALQLPVVLTKLAYLIDNPWTVSLDRANSAGLILADSLIDRNLGTRPITFVGYSLGSRVIFSCLKELSRKGAYGLVQNVYLFGSPVVVNREEYLRAKSVVAGRFVNGYATNDWILGYLFRLTSGGISRVAGLAPVEDIPGLENLNVTELVPGHMSYRTAMPRLLRHVGWVVDSDEFTEIEDPDPENHQQRQRELINEIEEARKELQKKEKEKETKGKFGFFSRKPKIVAQKADWEMYEDTKGNVPSKNDSPQGSLFDIKAIRLELAKEKLEVRELKSTLPPMKLDLNSSKPSKTGGLRTLMPTQQTKSSESSPMDKTHSQGNLSLGSAPLISEYIHGRSLPSYYYTEYQEENLELSFNLGPSPTGTNSTVSPALMQDPKNEASLDQNISSPPPVFNLGLSSKMASSELEGNAWADDYEFGEEEVQMTFA
ncbi:Bgt-4480 [Blumeria graminis f. sp. tritici]|uniref:Bgt-4480 n=1 Tax=Blumeria graminis f. sp. tritici TaxID=62690 RepID=A0A9X9QEH6_BLUGR|nr:Bgt-4480 [Blumeria graminis f. sp. tritici]